MWKLNTLYRGIEMRKTALPLLFLLLFSVFTIGQTT
jgi:hypothetical protein